MIKDAARPIEVRFTTTGPTFQASVAIEDLASLTPDPSTRLNAVAERYAEAITQIIGWRELTSKHKGQRKSTTARQAWQLGDTILRLREDLAKSGFAVVDLYASLSEHAGIPYWSNKFETFRSHLDDPDLIPEDLSWRSIRARARKAALAIAALKDPSE